MFLGVCAARHSPGKTHTSGSLASPLTRSSWLLAGRAAGAPAAAALGVGDEPLEGDVDVVLLLAGYRVAADLAILREKKSLKTTPVLKVKL